MTPPTNRPNTPHLEDPSTIPWTGRKPRIRDFNREGRVRELALAGKRPAEIAEALAYPVGYVYRVINRHGLPTNRFIHEGQPLARQILAALAHGVAPSQIQHDYRLSDHTWADLMARCKRR